MLLVLLFTQQLPEKMGSVATMSYSANILETKMTSSRGEKDRMTQQRDGEVEDLYLAADDVAGKKMMIMMIPEHRGKSEQVCVVNNDIDKNKIMHMCVLYALV